MSDLSIICPECEGEGGFTAKSHPAYCASYNGEECDCGGGTTQWIPCDECDEDGMLIGASVVPG